MRPGFLDPLLERQPFVVLDGGLATDLERRGADLHDPLWSARILARDPALVRAVHLGYYQAGADVAVSASYQATFPGLAAAGYDAAGAEALLRRSVEIAIEARDEFLDSDLGRRRTIRPLVAASIGSYGAYRHDGSEYTGEYGLTSRELARFHRDRFEVLASTGADLIAFETIPSRREAEVLVELLERRGGRHAWLAFTGIDRSAIADGTSFAESVASVGQSAWIAAAGLNCTAPDLVAPLLESAAPEARRPFVAYPNSGETFEARSGSWHGHDRAASIPGLVERWYDLGARLIGGCCRTTPDTIRAIRSGFEAPPADETGET